MHCDFLYSARLELSASIEADTRNRQGSISASPAEGSDEALSAYKKRFIYAFQPRFRSEFRIRIRPQYYELLQQIVASDLFNRLSLVDYLDRVLHEHLEENREAIERFCAHPEEREPQQ